jgi:CRISPR-associated protein Csm3
VNAVGAGGEFEGDIIFRDFHREQLELLCYSLGLDGSFSPKIGGNKPNGFGRVRISILRAEFRTHEGKVEFDPMEYASDYAVNDEKIEANKKLISQILA